jgi:hypothetical protein
VKTSLRSALTGLLLVARALSSAPCAVVAGEAQHSTSADYNDLASVIAEGTRLIEEKKYSEFLKRFMTPDELKKALGRGNLEDISAEFGKSAGAEILNVFKQIEKLTPTLDQTGTKATYQLAGEGVRGKTEFKFLRIEKVWYITD